MLAHFIKNLKSFLCFYLKQRSPKNIFFQIFSQNRNSGANYKFTKRFLIFTLNQEPIQSFIFTKNRNL